MTATWTLFSVCSPKASLAEESYLRINEVYPYPLPGEQEFVELKNFGSATINLDGWRIRDNTDIASHSFGITDETIGPESIIYFEGNFYLNNTGTEAVFLIDPEGTLIDGVIFENAQKGRSWSLEQNNWSWEEPSRGEENPEKEAPGNDPEEEPEEIEYPDDIRINEILPNPEGDESKEEYIELYNYSDKEIDLASWTVRDSSEDGRYDFPEETILGPQEFLAIYRTDFSFALNNSDESVILLDPEGEVVSQVSFQGSAKESVSYNFFRGEEWRWSSLLTPGEKNEFEEFPRYELTIPKKAFRNIYADFQMESDDEDLEVRWDFGDGKSSTQKEVRHKYASSGKYGGKVRIMSKSEEQEETFEVQVEKFKNKDIEIIALLPNPKGPDSEDEWIEIRNNGKEKTNLKDWSIASGTENLYNHPIREDFTLKAGKSKKLYRDQCAFSLGNEKGKIELRYPDGEKADSVKYEKEKIKEGEIYQKSDKHWLWTGGEDDENIEESSPAPKNEKPENPEGPLLEEIEQQGEASPNPLLGGKSEDASLKKSFQPTGQKLSPTIAHIYDPTYGTRHTIRERNSHYLFSPTRFQEHWLSTLVKRSNQKLAKMFYSS